MAIAFSPILLKSRFSAEPLDSSGVAHEEVKGASDGDWDTIIEAMAHVVSAPNGTAHRAFAGASYAAAGKTGTAQVFGLAEDEKYEAEGLARHLRDHSLFIGFAPVDNPVIAVAVVVEHGGHGSRAAAPVAREVIDAWLSSSHSGKSTDR